MTRFNLAVLGTDNKVGGPGGSQLTDSVVFDNAGNAGPSNGTDDTSALNALLASQKLVRGRPGETYLLTAPLVQKSGTTLDMTGCTVQLKTGSNCNLLQNYGLAHPAATGTATVALNSNVVTTAVAASVGQTAVITGAGGNGNGPLVGNISAAGGGTITLTTLDGRSALCTNPAGVTGAAITIYNRDTDIRILGGTWDRQNNGGTGTDNHSLLLRHVDGLTVDIEKYVSNSSGGTGGKYGVAPAGVTRFRCAVRDCATSSTPFQANGPMWAGRIDFVGGSSSDDLCALTAADYTAYQDSAGDIIGVEIGTLAGTSSGANLFRMIAGAGRVIDAIKVGEISGAATVGDGLHMGDDTAYPNTTGGTFGTVDVGLISAATSSFGYPANLISPAAEHVRVKVSHRVAASTHAAIAVTGTSTATIDTLVAEGDVVGTNAQAVQINNAHSTIRHLVVGMNYRPASPSVMANVHHGTVQVLTLTSECDFYGGSQAVAIDAADSGITGLCNIAGGNYSQGTILFSDIAGNSCQLRIGACSITGWQNVVQSAGTLTVILDGPNLQTISAAKFYANGGYLEVRGVFAPIAYPLTSAVGRAAAETVRCSGPGIPVDISILTPRTGETVLDTTSGVIQSYDGAHWQPVGSFSSRVNVDPYFPDSKVGAWSIQINTAAPRNSHLLSDGVQNSALTYSAFLPAGTWTLEMIATTSTNRGIYTVAIDGSTVGTIDGYTASSTFGTLSLANIAVATTGNHTITLTMATKNASSSSYFGTPINILMVKTA